MKRIAFVNPNFSNQRSRDAMEPLAFGILKALTPPEVDTVLVDERIEEIDFGMPCDAVAISVQSFTARRAYEISAKFRDRGIPVVMGGYHPTVMPDETSQHCDSVALGEAERCWPLIVDDLVRGSLKARYGPDDRLVRDVIPDRSVFKGKRYSILKPIQFGRGCKNACDFCSVHAVYGNDLYQRSVKSMIAEIDGMSSRYLLFVDDNILSNNRDTLALFRALKTRNRRWVCQISIDAAFDEVLVSTMADAGCIAVFVGLESLNPDNLQQIGKVNNLLYRDYKEAISRFKAHGIMFCGSFVFGYDADTVQTIADSYAFATGARLCIAHFNPLYPMPGTALYGRLQNEGRLRYDRWWLDPEFRYGQGMFHPVGMSVTDLGTACYRVRRKFNSLGNILYRLADRRTNSRNMVNAQVFLAANLVSRKEIRRKQHMELGVG